MCILEQGKVGQRVSLVGVSWRLGSAANIFARDSGGATRTMRSREQTCADEGRRYSPQYVHILVSLRDVLKEDAAGWASRSHTGRVRFTPKSVVLGALLQPQ